MPSGDPNFVTNDLLQHLNVDHQLSQNENDEYLANRHFRSNCFVALFRNYVHVFASSE